MKHIIFSLLVLLVVTCAWGCASPEDSGQKAKAWEVVFDGSNLDFWKPSDYWKIQDDSLHMFRNDKAAKGSSGYCVSKKKYQNFELKFEWRISSQGNSGVKYRYNQDNKGKQSLEYQVLDDIGLKDNKDVFNSASIYGVKVVPTDKVLKPIADGVFNTARIIANENIVQHWLNGKKVAEINISSKEWTDAYRQYNKKGVVNADRDAALMMKAGSIVLQNKGQEVWYRNMYIRELP